MKTEIVCIVALIAIFIIASVCIVLDLRLKKRFGKHRIVLHLVNDITNDMMSGIVNTVATEKERFKVVAEWAKISDESVISESCSVFFSHEHMCLLRTRREKRLMAYALAEQLKKHIISECTSLDKIKDCKYHIKTKCQSVLNGTQTHYLVHIYYIVPNEAYIEAEKW